MYMTLKTVDKDRKICDGFIECLLYIYGAQLNQGSLQLRNFTYHRWIQEGSSTGAPPEGPDSFVPVSGVSVAVFF